MLQSLGWKTGWTHSLRGEVVRPPARRLATASAIHRGLRRTKGAPDLSYSKRARPDRTNESDSRAGRPTKFDREQRQDYKTTETNVAGLRRLSPSQGQGRRDFGVRETTGSKLSGPRRLSQSRGHGRNYESDGMAQSYGKRASVNPFGKHTEERRSSQDRSEHRATRDYGISPRRHIREGEKDDGRKPYTERRSARDPKSSSRQYKARNERGGGSKPYSDHSESRNRDLQSDSWESQRRTPRDDAAGPRRSSRLTIPEDVGEGESSTGRYDRTSRNRGPLSIEYTTPASEFLYGTSVVDAALRADRRRLYKLYMLGGKKKDQTIFWQMQSLAMKRGVPVVMMDDTSLMDKMSTGRPHNGYVLEASPLKKPPVQCLLEVNGLGAKEFHFQAGEQSEEDLEINGSEGAFNAQSTQRRYPFVLFLDGVQDTGNLGGIIRTAHFMGVDAVVMSATCAPLNAVALKASAGSAESVPLLYVSDTSGFVQNSKQSGWDFYASIAPPSAQGTSKTKKRKHLTTERMESPLLTRPCVLMIGGEGTGLKQDLVKKADMTVSIAGHRKFKTTVDSLNVSVATGMLATTFLRLPADNGRGRESVFEQNEDVGEESKSLVEEDEGADEESIELEEDPVVREPSGEQNDQEDGSRLF